MKLFQSKKAGWTNVKPYFSPTNMPDLPCLSHPLLHNPTCLAIKTGACVMSCSDTQKKSKQNNKIGQLTTFRLLLVTQQTDEDTQKRVRHFLPRARE